MQNSQNNAVQERIKKMMRQKKLAKENQSAPSSRKRIASQTVADNQERLIFKKQAFSDDFSKKSDWTRRNQRSEKLWDTENSELTYYEGNTKTNIKDNRVEVEKLVNSIFSHSPKLMQYLSQYELGKQQAMRQLLSNELFVLSLESKISRLPQNRTQNDEYNLQGNLNGIIQNEIILKLTKLHRKKKHSLSLYSIQNRINSLITNRLEILKKY